MPLEILYDFCHARPGLTLTTWVEDDTLRITAMRASGMSPRFLWRTQADPMDGDLTKPLNEIAEALEEHDRQYALVTSR